MNSRVRPGLLAALVLAAPLMACARAPEAPTAQIAAAPAASVPSTPAAPLVTGLPDFTRLVEQVGPAVVHIEARIGSRPAQASRGGMPDEDQIPEIFRRFFGPDFPGMPGQPGQPDQDGPSGRSLGSGFIISADGYILTNHHVVDGADGITVRLSDRREFTAKLVGSDETYDVALLKVEGKGLPVLRQGKSAALKPGQWVVAIGSPLGLDQSVTAGIVSAVGRTGAGQQYVPFIQTDVAINRGNSGGPLLNTSGEVVGINSQILSNSGGYMGVSFAIPMDLAMGAVQQIKAGGRVSRGMLGVQVQGLDATRARAMGLTSNDGALVNSVEPGSAADKGGIEIGDVIVSVNGQAVATNADLPPMVGMLPPGSKARIGVVRDGKPRELTVTLGELPSDAQRAAAMQDDDGDTGPSATSSVDQLGLRIGELDAQSRRQMGLEAGEGVRITGVDGVEAREARLQPGMVILRVGRTPVGSVAAVERELRGAREGDAVMLLVRTPAGITTYIALTVGSGD